MARVCSQRVLIIEDDEDIRETLAATLDEEGYAVVTANNGRQALIRLRDGSPTPCLLLLDLMMPVMNGWEFRDEQRKDPSLADIPVVVVSADSRVREKADAIQADGALGKPVHLDELLAIVQHFCRTDRGTMRQPGEAAPLPPVEAGPNPR